jgi:hypothetical protein
LLETQPRILDDPSILTLLGPVALQRIKDRADHYRTPEMAALRAHVVLRSRFAEDRLAAAVLRGITQYVILGAGFDTFVLRQPSWAQALKIFEVDHLGTQAMKRSHLTAAGLAMPKNAAFAEARSIFFNQRSFNKDTPFASFWSGTASTTLAPDIVEANINGEEPDGLSLARLTRSFLSEWSEPRTL